MSTDGEAHEADFLVIALGADYDFDATPGLAEGGNEFYSVPGAQRLGELLPTFSEGRALIGVCGAPFKCPPAPSEAALLLHDYLSTRGVRGDCEISFVLPLGSPVPPSPDTSRALEAAFAERDIRFVPGRRVSSLDPARCVAVLDDGSEMPYDLFLGVPKHRAPDVVIESGMTEDGYVPVNPRTLETRFPGVYAVGDVATVGAPKAGVFAEGAARVVAASLIARMRGTEQPARLRRDEVSATSSSAPGGSVAWRSTSSPGRSRPAPSASPPTRSPPRSSTSAQAAAPAGSAAEPLGPSTPRVRGPGRSSGELGKALHDPRLEIIGAGEGRLVLLRHAPALPQPSRQL